MRTYLLRVVQAILLLIVAFPLPARAAATSVITVNTTADTIASDGLCSLREAVIAANTNNAYNDCPSGGLTDAIVFDAALGSPITILLGKAGAGEDAALSGDLDLFGALSIEGAGAVTLDGLHSDRLLDIHPSANVTLSGITLTHGDPGLAPGGAAYVRTSGRLTLNASQVISNTASSGGGVLSLGLVTVSGSTISDNAGGAMNNDGGGLVITNTQVTHNSRDYAIVNKNGGILSFKGGLIGSNLAGGLLNSNSAEATLVNLVIANNSGNGLKNAGPTTTRLTLNSSTVDHNSATSGAGLLNEGLGALATITGSSFSYNTATSNGGGINNSGSLSLTRSTLDHNQARAGGAINHLGASLSLVNVTLSQNHVTDNGGGLYNRSSASLNYVTLYGNTAGMPGTGGNLYNDGESTSIILHNTIFALGGAAGNCGNELGVIASQGYNLEDADTCGFTAPGDQVNLDPGLGPLQDNGGMTFTHALLPASPALGKADSVGCQGGTDQRGIARPQGIACDVGAYELVTPLPALQNHIFLPLVKR